VSGPLGADVLRAVPMRRGHFQLESGHHGDLWMELELLFRRPSVIAPFVEQLADRLRVHSVDAVCGPFNEGAFVALLVAGGLDCDFTYAERIADPRARSADARGPEPSPGSTAACGRARSSDAADAGAPPRNAMFPVEYHLPPPLHAVVRGRRVAIVNDVISAGSAVRGALADLDAIGARVVAIASLVVLGDAIVTFARERAIALETLAQLPYGLWTPGECPLCRAGVPVETVVR
jgi:orotate phosphoribosyltransferase